MIAGHAIVPLLPNPADAQSIALTQLPSPDQLKRIRNRTSFLVRSLNSLGAK